MSMARKSVPVIPGRGRGTNKTRGRGDPILIFLGWGRQGAVIVRQEGAWT
jgi:hypothetical protein